MLDQARQVGGSALRRMYFHERAKMFKALAQAIDARKAELHALNPFSGATRSDDWIDSDGGLGAVFVYASKACGEMVEGSINLDGDVEQLGRNGTFLGHYIAVPPRGVAVRINAFNFPVSGMLEKMTPAHNWPDP